MDYLVNQKIVKIYQDKSSKDDFDIADWNDELPTLKHKLMLELKHQSERENELLDHCIHNSMYKIKTWSGLESVFMREHSRFILDQLKICFEAQSLRLSHDNQFKVIYSSIAAILDDMKQVSIDQSVYQTKLMNQLQVIIEKDRADGDQIEFLRELSDCF